MNSASSDASGSFVVHSDGSGSVVVHDVPDDSGLSAPFFGGRGGGGVIGGSNSHAGRGIGGSLGGDGRGNALVAGRSGQPHGVGAAATELDSSVFAAAGEEGVGDMQLRRLPRPKPVLRWSQVPQESRPSSVPYLLNRYGRGGGVPATAGSGGAGLASAHGGGGLGDSLDAFKLYVADDGEMKMGDHHNEFFGFNYDAADDADDLMNLQQRQLSANVSTGGGGGGGGGNGVVGIAGGGGDFYQDTEDSAYGSSDSLFDRGMAFAAVNDGVGYAASETEGAVTDRRSWAFEPALLSKNVSRRRRLPPRRGRGVGRGGARGNSKGKGGGEQATRGRGGQHTRSSRPHRRISAGEDRHGEDGVGGDGGRAQRHSNRSTSLSTSAKRRNGLSGSFNAAAAAPGAHVQPGAHVLAGAAAYPNLPASLGALVLLSPANPTKTPLDNLTRLRRRLLRRQVEEEREHERRQLTRHAEQEQQQHQQSPRAAARASPRAAGTPHHNDSGNPRVPQSVTDLRFSLEDLNRSVGPATARMGAGASLAILRSARQRARESPRLQEMSLKGQAVYVRADPSDATNAAAAAAGPQRSDAAVGRGGRASSTGSVEVTQLAGSGTATTVGGVGSGLLSARQPRESRDPYTGVVTTPTEGQSVPGVALSCTAGAPFFHDPTAPRPAATVDVQPFLRAYPATSEATSSREVSLQTSFCAPLPPQSPTATYVLPSYLQRPPVPQQQQQQLPLHRRLSVQTDASSLHGSLRPPSMVPGVDVGAAVVEGSALCPTPAASSTTTNAPLFDDVAARHRRTETASFRDAHLGLPHLSSGGGAGGSGAETLREALVAMAAAAAAAAQKGEASSAGQQPAASGVPLSTGVSRAPQPMAGLGSGQRQRWRLHSGGGPTTALDNGAAGVGIGWNSGVAGGPPPWRWLYGPLPPTTPFSTTSANSAAGAAGVGSAGAGGRGTQQAGQRRASGSETGGAMTDSPFAEANTAASGGGTATLNPITPTITAVPAISPPAFDLQGFANACEAHWAALRSPASSSPRARPPGSPYAMPIISTQQLPLYPSAVAPYAAPRNPLEQNIRYNAWTADGVSASSGAACIVHVFTITRSMLRRVYEYVAYTCALRRERAAREREAARQRRMRDALAAGVLTRDLQRCLRCPLCGTVGQVAKVAPSRGGGGAGGSAPAGQGPRLSQLHSVTPRQLSPSMQQVRGMSSSQHGSPALRVSASATGFSLEAQKPHPVPAERNKRTLSSSEGPSPRRVQGSRLSNNATQATTPLAAGGGGSGCGSSTVVQAVAARDDDISAHDAVVTELPLSPASATEGDREEIDESPAVRAIHTATNTSLTNATANVELSSASDGGLRTRTTSPPPVAIVGVPAPSTALPPLSRAACTHSNDNNDSSGGPLAQSADTAVDASSVLPTSTQSNTAASSGFMPLGAATSPTAVGDTPKKRRISPTFTATTATVDSGDGAAEAPLERSCGSRELSQSFVAPQPHRASASQTEFQRYAVSSQNYSVGGGVLPSGLFSSDSNVQLPNVNANTGGSRAAGAAASGAAQRATPEREESSLRIESRASDGVPPMQGRSGSNSFGINADDDDNSTYNSNGGGEVSVVDRGAAPVHSPYGPMRRTAASPPQSLLECYMTPPNPPLARPGSASPSHIEFTAGGSPPATHVRRLLSPTSPSSVPGAASTLPPLAHHSHHHFGGMGGGGGSPSTPPAASPWGPIPRPPQAQVAASNRESRNGSFVGHGQRSVSALTPAVPPLAPSTNTIAATTQAGDVGGASVPAAHNTGGSAHVSKDPLGESANAAANRGSGALARRYVCQACHRDVVPKTSMVSLALLDERQPSKPVSEVATPTLAGAEKGTADATRAAGPVGVLAFEDLLRDDALVHALQTYLQDSIMLPATRPAQPHVAVLSSAVPEATSTAAANSRAAPSSSAAAASLTNSNHPQPMSSGSLFLEADVPHKTTMRSPTLPSTASLSPPSGGGGSGAAHMRASDRTSMSASRAQPAGAPRLNGEVDVSSAKEGTLAVAAQPLHARHTEASSKPQVPMPSFARLSLKSLASSSPASSSSPSVVSSPRSGVPVGRSGRLSPRHEDVPAAKPATSAPAPLLLRLCVPCYGLKVSVLERSTPPAAAAVTAAAARALAPLKLPGSEKHEPSTNKEGVADAGGAALKTPQLRRRSLGNETPDVNGRRPTKRFNYPPSTIPRMREDAATRGLTQPAVLMRRESIAAPTRRSSVRDAEGRHQQPAATLSGEGSGGLAARSAAAQRFSRRLQSRRDGRRGKVAAASPSTSTITQELSNSIRTMMQETDASKRHRVQVNARVHLDATSIDRIWERVFMQKKSKAVAAVATKQSTSPAKRLRAFAEAAAHTPPARAKNANAELLKAVAEPSSKSASAAGARPAELLASSDEPPARVHEPLGVDLGAYDDASVVLKVELAYPRSPGGNVRQLLNEWVTTYQPHPVLIEAVIRNIVYGVLTQLQALHAAGYTSGNVKSTNVFPLWHMVKATSEAGMRMPPREAAAATATTEAHSTESTSAIRGQAGSALPDEVVSFEGAARALKSGRAALNAAESANKSTAAPEEENEARPASNAAHHATRDSLHLSSSKLATPAAPAAVLPSQSPAPALSAASVSTPGFHAMTNLAPPQRRGAAARAKRHSQESPTRAAMYRRTSTKAPDASATAATTSAPNASSERLDQDNNNDDDDGDGGNGASGARGISPRGSGSQSARESFHRPTPSRCSALQSPSLDRPHLSPVLREPPSSDGHEGGHSAPGMLSSSDIFASHLGNSYSGSGAFPFSPALSITPSATWRGRRRWRGFSIDDSVIPLGTRGRDRQSAETAAVASAARRTRSAGPMNPRHRRRSDSAQCRSWEEQEELVPVLVEVMVPSAGGAPAASSAARSGERSLRQSRVDGAVSGGVGKTATASPRPRLSTVESMASVGPRSCTGPLPSRLDRHPSATGSSRNTANTSATAAALADGEEAVGLRYVRGAQLIPPARVLLPSLRSYTDGSGAGRRASDDAGTPQAASLLSSKQATADDSVSAPEVSSSMLDGARLLLASGPPGAVPRPKSYSYSHAGSSSTKAAAAGRDSESEADRDASDDRDCLDPLQWSQQVMLVENLGMRVETAVRLAMKAVLTQHPPCAAATSTAAAESGAPSRTKETQRTISRNAVTPSPLSPASVQARPPRAAAASASGGGASSSQETALNVYVPDLSGATPPEQPLLFGIQESEYVPAPETIRTARDEAKALWRLWREEQQHSRLLSPSVGTGDRGTAYSEADMADSEAVQMEYVAAQLAEQACPATTLRNTLDPYARSIAAVDVWQLGMLALDLADGAMPTTWLKQREPTPRLSPYPWSSYFQSFVSSCLQVRPERRATSADLLKHAWFRVALVPQATSGGGDRGLRGGRLGLMPHQHSLTPPQPRLSCVMGVDGLTAAEQEEWEAFDYTLLYGGAEGGHPLAALPSTPSLAQLNPTSSISGRVNAMGRLRRASAGSASESAMLTSATERAAAAFAHHPGASSSAAPKAMLPHGGDSAAVSQSLGISGGNNVSGVSMTRFGSAGAATAANTAAANAAAAAAAAAAASAVDAEFTAMASVDVAQYFTRLATIQWRRLQQQQYQQQQQQHLQSAAPPSLAGSFNAPGANRSGPTPQGLAGDTISMPDVRGMGNALLNTSFFEHSLHLNTEDMRVLLRQPNPTNARHVQLGSPRQNLYNVISPRPPQTAALGGVSQAQQTDGTTLSPLLPWGNPHAAAMNGAAYGLPSALNAAAAAAAAGSSGTASPAPPLPLPPPSARVAHTKPGLPSSYVPLRDPRGAAMARSTTPTGAAAAGTAGGNTNASTTPLQGIISSHVSPRWVSVSGEASSQAPQFAGVSLPQSQGPLQLQLASARDTQPRFDGRHAHVEKYDPHWGELSELEPRIDPWDAAAARDDASESSYGSESSGDDDDDDEDGGAGCSFGGQSSWSSSSAPAYLPGHSSSYSRSGVSSLDDAHQASRGGGEVPFRRTSNANARREEGGVGNNTNRVPPTVLLTRDAASGPLEGIVGQPQQPQPPLILPSFPPPFASAVALRGGKKSGGRRGRVAAQSPPSQVPGADWDGDGAARRPHGTRQGYPPHHLLLGTLATSLARLSAVVATASASDSAECSDGDESVGSVDSHLHSRSISAADRDGHLNNRSRSFPGGARGGRRQTQNYCEPPWEEHMQQQQQQQPQAEDGISGKSVFTPLSSLAGYQHARSEKDDADEINAERKLVEDGDASSHSDDNDSCVSSSSEAESGDDVEEQCDEILRCFSSLQRGCPMAVNVWCLRLLQQAARQPRTATTASHLLAQAERRVHGGAEARNLAWLKPQSDASSSSTTTAAAAQKRGDEMANTGPVQSAVAAPAASAPPPPPPPPTPSPVLETCPSSFHNYELAKWLYAAHQSIPRCV